MKKTLLSILFIISLGFNVLGQVYLDEFDNDLQDQVYYNMGYSGEEADGEWTITGDGSSGAWEVFGYSPHDENGEKILVDITGNNKIFVRAKASINGTSLRMDAIDSAGFSTTLAGITKTLINDYTVFEFDFTNGFMDGGYGGTACSEGPCPVDGTKIREFQFYINPGVGSYTGTIVIDFISVGSEPDVGPTSSIFQDHFTDTISLNYMGSASPGLVNTVDNSIWTIRGDGTNGQWDPVNLLFYNPATGDTTDVSVGEGNDKVYVRMKSSVAGTSVRLDLQDINGFVTTAGSITKLITDEWETYEYNYAGSYQDLAYGGTACTTGPCPVDPDRISNMILFVNPGVEAFVGDVEIDYISVGTALEDTGGDLELVYGDHFSENSDFISTSGAYNLSFNNSSLIITGDGVDDPFSAVAYTVHDKDAGIPITVNATGNNKLFIRAKSNAVNTLLRIDLVDTTGYVTSQPSFTRLLEEDFVTLELDFTSAYIDAGYGGTPCETGPCEVDGKVISTVLLYPNPADGGFMGDIEIDFISFGAPMGDDVISYNDHFDNGDRSFWTDAGGFTVEESGTELTLTGDGTAGAYSSFVYTPHDTAANQAVVLDLTSNNKLYVKAKSSVAGAPLRIDLVDAGGFATTNPSRQLSVGEEYSILEYDFTGTYTDGGFGGTSCTMGPCAVDGTTISSFLVYIDPDNGGFNGTVTIDWISTLEPLEEEEETPLGVDEYADDFTDGSLDFLFDNGGLALTSADGVLTITGDGTSGAYAPIIYEMHDGTDSLIVNAVSNSDKLFIKAKSSVNDLPLRIDIQDNAGYLTSQAGVEQLVSTEYQVLEYNYAGKYIDGGFGGTACETGPCSVDGKRIQFLQMYIKAGTGLFDGTLDIDWISFGEEYTVSVIDHNIVSSGKIYPNPAKDVLYLEIDSKQSGIMIGNMIDFTGKVVRSENLGTAINGKTSAIMPVEQLVPGMYILYISINGKSAFSHKVIIR
ncbi:MAG: T9SS type A sorting domain-containing protein [Saprospiraceae bacterium]|nr:T9SS type A sorting domain-containing protein [Saprospiraceae bacterium]